MPPTSVPPSHETLSRGVETRPGELIFKIRDGRRFVLKPKGSKGANLRHLGEEAKKPARAPLGCLPASPPEKLRDVFNNSAALQVVWERACESVCARARFLVRANRLQDLLCELGTSRYRMQCRGLAPVCHLGIHTTLYALADVLAHYVCSACEEDISFWLVREELERVIAKSIVARHGVQIPRKALSELLGGDSVAQKLIKDGRLKPVLRSQRNTLFAIKAIERAVQLLRCGEGAKLTERIGMARIL